jgi:hypothetical protein
MRTDQNILEPWLACLLEDYPGQTASFLLQDKFRNPVGYTLRENLATVLEQLLLPAMDISIIRTALENIVRIRAVQDLNESQAVGFVFQLKPILQELRPADAASFNSRIEHLSQIASQEFRRCREQVAEIRLRERRRTVGGVFAVAQARHNR